MRIQFLKSVLLLAPFVLSACSSLPDFDGLGVGYKDQTADHGVVQVSDVVDHIRCELYRATEDGTLSDLTGKHYVAAVLLYLKVDDNGALAPSFSLINPARMTDSLTASLNVQVNETRERTFSQSFLFDIGTIANDKSGGCRPLTTDTVTPVNTVQEASDGFHVNGINLLGDLGLADVARMGLKSIPAQDQVQINKVSMVTYLNSTSSSAIPDPNSRSLCGAIFGSSMQFTLVRSAGVGPSWTLKHFKGPSGSGGGSGGGGSGGGGGSSGGSSGGGGGSSGLLSAGRTDTHQLLIGFAPTGTDCTQPPPTGANKVQALLDFKTAVTGKAPKDRLMVLNSKIQSATNEPARNALLDTKAVLQITKSKNQMIVLDQQIQKAQTQQADEERQQSEENHRGSAAAAAQGVINTMILQNLTSLGSVP